MSGYWPFWLGGLALAVVALGYWRAIGRLLGVSGSFATVLRRPAPDPFAGRDPGEVEAALVAATREAFGDRAVAPGAAAVEPAAAPVLPRRFGWSDNAALLAGLVLGGALGALSRGAWALRFDLGAEFARLVGGGGWSVVALVGGGLLVGFGTQMAGGCTSGHGLCGTSRLQRGSLLATVAFFGAAVAVSFLLARLAR